MRSTVRREQSAGLRATICYDCRTHSVLRERQIKRMPRQRFNRKRRIDSIRSESELAMLAGRVTYGGNPEHKRSQGNFGLTPPAAHGPTSQCAISARQERT